MPNSETNAEKAVRHFYTQLREVKTVDQHDKLAIDVATMLVVVGLNALERIAAALEASNGVRPAHDSLDGL